MTFAGTVVDLVGDTPLVRLGRVTEGLAPLVLAKVEYFNPGGSVKDRIAVGMIEAAEADGRLKPGGTIVEPTSGNTGVGLALVAQQRGYQCVFVCPDKVSEDKRNVLAYGAEVVVCPTAVEPEHPDSYYSVSDRLAREIAGAWKPDQYSNPEGPASHYATTGPGDLARHRGPRHALRRRRRHGRHDHGHRPLPEGGLRRPGRAARCASSAPTPRARSTPAAPAGPTWSRASARTSGRPPTTRRCPTRSSRSRTPTSFEMTRRLAREEGLLVGGSCGMAVVAALRVAQRLGPDDVVVVLLPDGGRGYLSKIFNDRWMASYGFVARGGAATVGDVLRGKSGSCPTLVHTHPSETVRDAIEILREYDVSQMPVVKAEPPVMAGEVAGAVTSATCWTPCSPAAPRSRTRSRSTWPPPLPLVGAGEPVDGGPARARGRRRRPGGRRRQAGRRADPARPARVPRGLTGAAGPGPQEVDHVRVRGEPPLRGGPGGRVSPPSGRAPSACRSRCSRRPCPCGRHPRGILPGASSR